MSKLTATFPNPLGLEFNQWGSVVAEQLAAYGVVTPAESDQWKDWACGLFYIPALAEAPTPMEFEKWEDWASRFIETFS